MWSKEVYYCEVLYSGQGRLMFPRCDHCVSRHERREVIVSPVYFDHGENAEVREGMDCLREVREGPKAHEVQL